MGSGFAPKLTTTDWNEEWMRLQKTRRAADDAAYWDERSKTFHKKPGPSPYVDRFIAYADLEPSDAILDMGCGNGALAIPLALAGHKVIAADFSRGMLDSLEHDSHEQGALSIETKRLSWDDDWERFGVGAQCVDVAFASRSIATHDLEKSLRKLSATARRRCCITLPVGSSPRVDARILSALGIQARLGSDFAYAFMILQRLGYLPEVRYIPSIRRDTYASAEEATESLGRMVVDAARDVLSTAEVDAALERLRAWVRESLVPNPEAGDPGQDGLPQKDWVLREPRQTTWAFLSWRTDANASSK